MKSLKSDYKAFFILLPNYLIIYLIDNFFFYVIKNNNLIINIFLYYIIIVFAISIYIMMDGMVNCFKEYKKQKMGN